MKIALLDPFHSGSHQAWSVGLARHSRHEVRLFTLPGRHWKWRMHGAAISMATLLLDSGFEPDAILTTDMMALDTLSAICRKHFPEARLDLYFHENQLTYPWSLNDPDIENGRDNHYAFINVSSAIAADRIFFNSQFHMRSFLQALPAFCKQFPPPSILPEVEKLNSKSEVLYLGIDLSSLNCPLLPRRQKPVILWNHRWEYDKGPEEFFSAIFHLQDEGWEFEIIVLGKQYGQSPEVFSKARERLGKRVLHWGYAPGRKEYAQLLRQADILPVTSRQDFFGISVIEAMYCGVFPILPDRLAFPEHLPQKRHPECFYNTPEEFIGKLRSLLSQRFDKEKMPFKTYAARYDWQVLIHQYDERL